LPRNIRAQLTVEIETLRARLAALERELAEGRRREQTLVESEARYRTLFEYSNDLIFSCTLDGIITNVNRATESTLGWSRQELIGEHVLKILTPASFRLGQERVHRTLAGERLAEVFKLEALGKDGSIVPLEGWAHFIIGRDGAPVEHQGVYRDVSERTRAERALWETEERHRSLLESAPDPLVVYDMEGRVTSANPAFVRTFGWAQEELLGRRVDFVPEDQIPTTRAALRRVLSGEAGFVVDTRRLTKDGRVLDVELTASLFRNRQGQPLGSIVLLRDVTARRHAEDELQTRNRELIQELHAGTAELARSVEEMKALADVSQAVSSSLDLRRVLDTIVRHAVNLSGSAAGAVFEFSGARQTFVGVASHNLTRDFLETIESTPVNPERGVLRRAVETGQPFQIPDIERAHDYIFRQLTLEEGYRALLAVPIAGGDVTRGFVVFRREPGVFDDRVVTLLTALANQSKVAIDNARLFEEIQNQRIELERLSRNMEELSRLSTAVQEPLSLKEQLHRVLEGARGVVAIDRVYVWAVSREGDKLVNLAGAGFSEDALREFEGAEIPLGEAGAMYKAYREGVPLVFNEQNPLPRELYLNPEHLAITGVRTRSFLVVPMIARGQTVGLLTGDNKPTRRPIRPQTVELLQIFAAHAAVAIENARLFQEIEDKSRQLEVASRHKSEFLASMSHELRTPLNAIIGFSEVLHERMFGDLNPKQAEYIQDIHASGRHLLSLINDILDLSKVEAGRLELELGRFHLPTALDQALTLVRERASRHGIALEVSVDERLGEIVGDERKIRQILLNLLSNAVKFTPEGGRIDVTATAAEGLITISVSDTGIGIAPEDQEAVFEEFRQVGRDDARKQEGTGLGLALAKKFVELHGGQIWVRSQMGQGSTFTFTLPVRPERTSSSE
jgi:PAS domain S-box-containing protein